MNEITKRTAESGTRRSAMTCAVVVTVLLLGNFPAGAGAPTCQRQLGTTDVTLINSVLHLRAVARAPEDQQCAAYRRHVTTVSQVREVFDRCLSGAQRETDLRQLEGVLDDANGVIARICGQVRQSAGPAPSDPAGMP